MINKFSCKTRVMQGLLAQSVVHLIGSSLTDIDCERVQTQSGHILLSGQLNLKANSLVRRIPYVCSVSNHAPSVGVSCHASSFGVTCNAHCVLVYHVMHPAFVYRIMYHGLYSVLMYHDMH